MFLTKLTFPFVFFCKLFHTLMQTDHFIYLNIIDFWIINVIITCIMTLGLEIELISVMFSSELREYALYYFINPLR